MKPNELRIGNHIKITGSDKIHEVWSSGVMWVGENMPISCSAVEGIKLTPEWLERFGFKKQKASDFYIDDWEDDYGDDWDLFILNNQESWFDQGQFIFQYADKETFIEDFKIKHVHQLQNLYFALTGKELKENG